MNLLEVELEHFLSHRKTHVSFPSGLTGVLGLNGSGKSSLIKDGVTWVFWGESRASGSGDDLISDDEDFCSGIVRFESSNKRYEVTRTRTRGKKTTLKLVRYGAITRDVVDLSHALLAKTQEEINKALGMSYDVFKNSCCIEQGESSSFSKLTPSQASKVLLKILQLDKYEKYNKVVSETLKTLGGELNTVETSVGFLREKLVSVQNTVSIRTDKSHQLSTFKEMLAVQALELSAAEATEKLIGLAMTNISTKLMEVTTEIESLNTLLLKLGKQSALLNKVNGSCPLCETHLTLEVKAFVKKKVQDEIDSLMSKMGDLEVQRLYLTNDFTARQEERRVLKVSDRQVELKSLTNSIASLEGELLVMESSRLSEDSVTADFKLAQDQLDSLKTKQVVYTKLRDAFGPKGIPLLVIDNTIRELEVLINDNLKVLSDMPSSVELATQYESTDGSLIDTFEINIVTSLQKRPYFNYSGGERFIIDLAIRLGLSELLARRNNFKVETLIIDEGLGSLDGPNQVNFFTALTRLVGRFEKILVITHTSVKEYFKNVIEVKNQGGISVLDKHVNTCYTNIER